jgi:hypothetical protein
MHRNLDKNADKNVDRNVDRNAPRNAPKNLVLSIGALVGLGTVGLSTTCAAADSTANDYWVRASVAAWMAPLDGDFAYGVNGGTGDSASTDELGLDDSEVNLMGEISLQIPFFLDVHLGGWNFGTEGRGQLTRDIAFGDQTFSASDMVATTVDLSDIYGEIAWGLNTDLVGASIGLAVHWMSAEIKLVDETASLSDSADGSFPIPALALRAHVNPLDVLGVEAVVHGLSLGLGDVEANVLDARLQVVYRPLAMLGVFAGYRHLLIDIAADDGEDKAAIDVTLSGPYLGLLAQF